MKFISILIVAFLLTCEKVNAFEPKISSNSEIEPKPPTGSSLYLQLFVGYLNMLNKKLLVDKSLISSVDKMVLAVLLSKMGDENLIDKNSLLELKKFVKEFLIEKNPTANNETIAMTDQRPKYMHWRQGRSILE